MIILILFSATPLMLAASLGDIDHADLLADKLAEVDAQVIDLSCS